jgi:ABC-2 type transport system permease protein
MERPVNVFWLGVKELRNLRSDRILVLLAFTLSIYTQARGTSSDVNNASIPLVDEVGSTLTRKIVDAFYSAPAMLRRAWAPPASRAS